MKISVKEVKLENEAKTIRRIIGDGVKVYANTRLHAYCSPYVPMDTGMLEDRKSVGRERVF